MGMMSGLRVATKDDLDVIVKLGMKFASVSPYKDFVSEENVRNLAMTFLEANKEDYIILLYDDIGMIAGMATPFIFGNAIVASELIWWVEPEYRANGVGEELINAFEYWAKEKAGCSLITMVCLDDLLGKFYESKGYKLQERAYMKVI